MKFDQTKAKYNLLMQGSERGWMSVELRSFVKTMIVFL